MVTLKMNNKRPSEEPAFGSWLRLVAASCEEGRYWCEQYLQDEHKAIERNALHSLVLLRKGKIEAGCFVLASVESGLRDVQSAPASVLFILQRWYYGILAYAHYCCERFDEALQALDQADSAVSAAIELAPFLVTFADHCFEFRLQRARIARNRRRWKEMRRYIEDARKMIEGGLPFCVLSDGRAIYRQTVREFCASLSLSLEARVGPGLTTDVENRLKDFDQIAVGLYAKPGLVIPYSDDAS
jgi:tetratricopeptide (TPR) repeat protein